MLLLKYESFAFDLNLKATFIFIIVKMFMVT